MQHKKGCLVELCVTLVVIKFSDCEEKQKLEKGDKPKKKAGGKIKARLRMDGENQNFDEYAPKYDDFDEYDDFM